MIGACSGRYAAGSGWRGPEAGRPGVPNDESRLVTLGEEVLGVCAAGRKIGSSFHDASKLGFGLGAAGAGGSGLGAALACAGRGVEAGGAALKNCVKLPSPDTEPDTPGEEKPLPRDGPAAGVARGASSTLLF
jgi:hypothetical protein